MSEQPPVKLADLEDALMFVDAGNGFDTAAWVCLETGAVLWRGGDGDDSGPLSEDIDDAARYVAVPDKREFGLGKPLALEFARAQLPTCHEQVGAMFSHRGACPRFKDLRERHQSLDVASVGGGADAPGAARMVHGQQPHPGRLTGETETVEVK